MAIATANEEEEPPPSISQQEAERYLSASDELVWERAQALIKAGESQIASGISLQNRKPSKLKLQSDPNDSERNKRLGQEKIDEGEAKIAEGKKIINELKAKAIALKNRRIAALTPQAQNYTLTLSLGGDLTPSLKNCVEQTLLKLRELQYTRLYFGGLHSLQSLGYEKHDALSKKMHSIVQDADQGRTSIIASNDGSGLSLGTSVDRAIIDVPQRKMVLSNFQSAALFAELIYSPHEAHALLSVRAIRLSDMGIAASETLFIPVNESFFEATGFPAHEVGPTSKDQMLTIKLEDTQSFVRSIIQSDTPYFFRFAYKGYNGNYEARRTALLTKLLLAQTDLIFTDIDFLSFVLPPSATINENIMSLATNAVWTATPLETDKAIETPLGATTTYNMTGRSVRAGKTSPMIPIGSMTVALVSSESR